jgi:hypothetical protein
LSKFDDSVRYPRTAIYVYSTKFDD